MTAIRVIVRPSNTPHQPDAYTVALWRLDGNGQDASGKGNDLAVKGHIIRRHSDPTGRPQRLIVVGGFDPAAPESLKRRIEFILRECDTRLIREDKLDEFVEEIRREAHS